MSKARVAIRRGSDAIDRLQLEHRQAGHVAPTRQPRATHLGAHARTPRSTPMRSRGSRRVASRNRCSGSDGDSSGGEPEPGSGHLDASREGGG
jgi:hypothetical protein